MLPPAWSGASSAFRLTAPTLLKHDPLYSLDSCKMGLSRLAAAPDASSCSRLASVVWGGRSMEAERVRYSGGLPRVKQTPTWHPRRTPPMHPILGRLGYKSSSSCALRTHFRRRASSKRDIEPTGHHTLSTCGAGVGGSSRRHLQRQRRLRGRGIRGALEPRRQLIEGRVEKPLPPAVPPKPQSPPRSSTHRWPSGSVSAVPPRQRLPVCSADLSPPPLPRRL